MLIGFVDDCFGMLKKAHVFLGFLRAEGLLKGFVGQFSKNAKKGGYSILLKYFEVIFLMQFLQGFLSGFCGAKRSCQGKTLDSCSGYGRIG